MPPVRFQAPAGQYDRFIGRYLPTLSVGLADLAGIAAGMRVLDVGCGPGGLTVELARRVGAGAVAAIDPAEQFVAACRDRVAGADVRVGVAEALPWEDDSFDAVLCSLVVPFMRDPEQGVRELVRVTRPGGVVAACMWDTTAGGMTMLRLFWESARAIVPAASGEQALAGGTEGDLAARLERAGLAEVSSGALAATGDYAGADDFWEPFTFGIGPAGGFLTGLDPAERDATRTAVVARLPDGPFTLEARAWCARGTKPV